MLFREILEDTLKYYGGVAEYFNAVIADSPTGHLVYQKCHGNDQFFQYYKDVEGVHRNQIHNENNLKAMARKEFAEKSLTILNPNVQLLKNAVSQIVPYDPDSILKSMGKAYSHLPEDYFFDRNKVNISMHLDDESKSRIERHREWGRQPYNQSLYLPEYKKTRTSKGLMVRSKSEALICETLYRICDIPHRYEQEKVIDGYIYIPDFTFEAFDFSELYWDHFGMMGKPEYAAKNFKKLQICYDRGIIPGKNLILTFDINGTIDMKYIEGVIMNEVIPRL